MNDRDIRDAVEILKFVKMTGGGVSYAGYYDRMSRRQIIDTRSRRIVKVLIQEAMLTGSYQHVSGVTKAGLSFLATHA